MSGSKISYSEILMYFFLFCYANAFFVCVMRSYLIFINIAFLCWPYKCG